MIYSETSHTASRQELASDFLISWHGNGHGSCGTGRWVDSLTAVENTTRFWWLLEIRHRGYHNKKQPGSPLSDQPSLLQIFAFFLNFSVNWMCVLFLTYSLDLLCVILFINYIFQFFIVWLPSAQRATYAGWPCQTLITWSTLRHSSTMTTMVPSSMHLCTGTAQ